MTCLIVLLPQLEKLIQYKIIKMCLNNLVNTLSLKI